MNTDSEKDQTQDQSPAQPASASAGSEGDTAADTTTASTTGQGTAEEERTVEKTSPSPPSENTGTADQQRPGFVFGPLSGYSRLFQFGPPKEDLTWGDRGGSTEEKSEHSGTDGDHTGGSWNVNEESNVEDFWSHSFPTGTTSTPKFSGDSSSPDTPNVSRKNRKPGSLRFANLTPGGFHFSNGSDPCGSETHHVAPFLSGTGGNASSPKPTPLLPAPLQQTPDSSHPPLGKTGAGGSQSREQAVGGQSREQAGGSQSREQAGGGQSREQAGGGQSSEQAGGGQSAESFAPTPAHESTAVAEEGAGAPETGEDQGDPNMSKNPAESCLDSGIGQSQDDVDDASSNAQTSPQKESEAGDDRRSPDPTTLSSLSADEKLGANRGPPADRPTSPGDTSKNSGGGASSQDPEDSCISSGPFSGKGEAMGGAAMNSRKPACQRRLAITARKTRGVQKPHSGTSGSPASRESGDGIKSLFNVSQTSSPAPVVPATPGTELGPRDSQDGGGQGEAEALRSEVKKKEDQIWALTDTITRQSHQLVDKEELGRSYQDVRRQLEESERIRRELEASLKDAGTKFDEAQAQFQEREATLKEELEKSRQETRKTLEDSERIEADLRAAQEELAVARRRLEEQGTQSHEELRKQIQDLQENLQESERIHGELKSKLDDVSDELQQTERARDNHERKALRLELYKRDLTEELDRLKKELQEKSSQIPHLTKERDDARNERDRLAKELEDERLRVEQERNIASTLQNHGEMLQSQVQEREEVIRGLRDDLARYTRQLADKDGLENDLQDRLRESERIREELESRLRGSLARADEMERTLSGLRDDHERGILELKGRMLELIENRDRLKEKTQADASRLDELHAERDSLADTVTELTQAKRQLEERQTELENHLALAQRERDEMEVQRQVLEVQKTTAHEQAMMFGNQTSVLEVRSAQLQTMYQAKERELEEHTNASRRRIQEMTARMRELQNSVLPFETEAQRARLETTNIQEQLREMQNEKGTMSITIRELRAEVERCESAVRECHRREEEMRQEISNKEDQKQRYLKETRAARRQVNLLRNELNRLRLRLE